MKTADQAISKAIKAQNYEMGLVLLEQLKLEMPFSQVNQNQHLTCLYALHRDFEVIRYSREYNENGNKSKELLFLTGLSNFRLSNFSAAYHIFSEDPAWERWKEKARLCFDFQNQNDKVIEIKPEKEQDVPKIDNSSTTMSSTEGQQSSQQSIQDQGNRGINVEEKKTSETKVSKESEENKTSETKENNNSEDKEIGEILETLQNKSIEDETKQYKWNQTEKQIIITISIEGIKKEQIKINCIAFTIDISISRGSLIIFSKSFELFDKVIPKTLNLQCTPKEIIITLDKLKQTQWPQLEITEFQISELMDIAELRNLINIQSIEENSAIEAYKKVQPELFCNF